MSLNLCVGHLEQYYKNDLGSNSFMLAHYLKAGIVVKINPVVKECDWCKLGMPTFT